MKYINKNQLNNISLNKDNFYILIDFDRTVTNKNSPSTWKILYYSNLLGKDFQEKYDSIHNKFPNIETNEKSNDKQKQNYINRFKEYFELLKDCQLNEKIIKEAVKKTDIKLRKGAADFFKKMNEKNIPVIIISCGVKNLILEYLKFNNSYYNNIHIYANYIDLNEKGLNNIYNITPYNKNEISFSKDIVNKIKNKEYILLIGDILNDIDMVDKKDLKRTIKIGFLDNNIKENLDKYIEKFDVVLTNGSSFKNVEKILKI